MYECLCLSRSLVCRSLPVCLCLCLCLCLSLSLSLSLLALSLSCWLAGRLVLSLRLSVCLSLTLKLHFDPGLILDQLTKLVPKWLPTCQHVNRPFTQPCALSASMTLSVAFTVTFSGRDLEGLDHRKGTLRFDKVLLNAGDGYDANTGVFRAPKAGLYAFDIHVSLCPSINPHVCGFCFSVPLS